MSTTTASEKAPPPLPTELTAQIIAHVVDEIASSGPRRRNIPKHMEALLKLCLVNYEFLHIVEAELRCRCQAERARVRQMFQSGG